MDLAKDLLEVIEKNLPAATGAALQARLREADQDRRDLELTRGLNNTLRKDNERLSESLHLAEAALAKCGDLAKREEAVAERERAALVDSLKNQLAAETDKANFAKSVALGLVRNVEYRHEVFESRSQAVPVPQGGYPHTHNETHSYTEKKVTE